MKVVNKSPKELLKGKKKKEDELKGIMEGLP